MRRQPQQRQHPGPERARGEPLAGGRVERQLVLREDAAGEREVLRRLAEGHGHVRGPQRVLLAQPLLDRPRDPAQLPLAVERALGTDGDSAAARRQLLDGLGAGERFEARRRPARPLARLAVDGDEHAGAVRQGRDERLLARVEELERVDEHEARQPGTVLDRLRGQRGRLAGIAPAAIGQCAPVGVVDVAQRAEVGAPRLRGGFREGRRLDIRGHQLRHGLGDERVQARLLGDRLEAASPARGDALQRDAPQQVRRHVPRQRPPGGVQARVLRQRGDIEVERDAAPRDQAAAELVAVPRRRHEHERRGEAVVLVAPRGVLDEPPGLAGPRGPVHHRQLAHHCRL